MKFNKKGLALSTREGFTLIEILVVIGILAILFAIALVAINPARQFSQANNTKRSSDSLQILNAIGQYMADNKGVLPTGITASSQNISNTGADLCAALTPRYLAAMPRDPSIPGGDITNCAAAYDTGYTVVQGGADNRITVSAPAAELGASISVTR